MPAPKAGQYGSKFGYTMPPEQVRSLSGLTKDEKMRIAGARNAPDEPVQAAEEGQHEIYEARQDLKLNRRRDAFNKLSDANQLEAQVERHPTSGPRTRLYAFRTQDKDLDAQLEIQQGETKTAQKDLVAAEYNANKTRKIAYADTTRKMSELRGDRPPVAVHVGHAKPDLHYRSVQTPEHRKGLFGGDLKGGEDGLSGGLTAGEAGLAGGEAGLVGGEAGLAGGETGLTGGEEGLAGGEAGLAGGEAGLAGGNILGGQLEGGELEGGKKKTGKKSIVKQSSKVLNDVTKMTVKSKSPQRAKAVKDAEILVQKTKKSKSKSPVKKQAIVVEEKVEEFSNKRRSPRLLAARKSALHMVKLASSDLKGGEELSGGTYQSAAASAIAAAEAEARRRRREQSESMSMGGGSPRNRRLYGGKIEGGSSASDAEERRRRREQSESMSMGGGSPRSRRLYGGKIEGGYSMKRKLWGGSSASASRKRKLMREISESMSSGGGSPRPNNAGSRARGGAQGDDDFYEGMEEVPVRKNNAGSRARGGAQGDDDYYMDWE